MPRPVDPPSSAVPPVTPENLGRDRADHIQDAWRRERPDLDPSSVAVVTRIWLLAKEFGDRRRRLLGEHGMDPAVMDLLGTLRRDGQPHEVSTRELADRAGVSAGAITQRVDRAIARGWVTRTRAGQRRVLVRLTPAGLKAADRLAALIFAADDDLVSGLSADQRRQLAELLRRLTLSLEGDLRTDGVGS